MIKSCLRIILILPVTGPCEEDNVFGIHTRLMKIYYKHLANQDITARVIKDWNPDSNFRCRKFPEAGRLWKEWTKDNETNNCVDFSRFYSLLLNLDYVLRGRLSENSDSYRMKKG